MTEPMPEANWLSERVFGTTAGTAVVRPAAYAVVVNVQDQIAVVRTPTGVYLPGGGALPDEEPAQTMRREIDEECGLIVRLGDRSIRAVQYVYSEEEQTEYENHCVFFACTVESVHAGREDDHELVWVDPATAVRILTRESHRWAVHELGDHLDS